jgi:uncharacterized protein YjiS (DUF1127 family)
MTPMLWLLLGALRVSARAIARRARRVASAIGRLNRIAQHRRRAAVLAQMDKRMLADMGLTRADLRDAFAQPLWKDPTAHLRARALERRLAHHGASLGFPPETPGAPSIVSDGLAQPPTNRPARFTV